MNLKKPKDEYRFMKTEARKKRRRRENGDYKLKNRPSELTRRFYYIAMNLFLFLHIVLVRLFTHQGKRWTPISFTRSVAHSLTHSLLHEQTDFLLFFFLRKKIYCWQFLKRMTGKSSNIYVSFGTFDSLTFIMCALGH